jgi:chromosome segregation ATPase
MGKSLISSLTAKVEKLQETVTADNQKLREISHTAEQADRKASQLTQDLGIKLERGQVKLQSLLAELSARQNAVEYKEDQESERVRMMTEELNTLRYKLESFSLQSAEVGNEVRARAREIEYESARGADTMRVIKDHEHALESLHHSIDTSSDALSKKVDMSLLEMRQRIDTEGRSRFQFEHGCLKIFYKFIEKKYSYKYI